MGDHLSEELAYPYEKLQITARIEGVSFRTGESFSISALSVCVDIKLLLLLTSLRFSSL